MSYIVLNEQIEIRNILSTVQKGIVHKQWKQEQIN